jgi:pimeloyl-ACP methyl ester carboxylesterase
MMDKHALILLPGLLCDDALWTHQVAFLDEIADVRVADLTREDNIPDMARHVLARAPEHFAIAGMSMGGYVAQEIMRQAPHRVQALALLDTNARADLPDQIERRKALMEEAELGQFKGIGPKLLPALVHPDFAKDEDITATVLGMAARVGKDAFLRQQNAIMHRVDGLADLPHINCPTLVLCGADDAVTPVKVHAEMVIAIGDNADLVVVEHCGHLSPLEQPEEVSAAMFDWLLGI